MTNLKTLLRIAWAAFAAMQLAACSKTVQWEEEVLLNTGETLLVQRSGTYTYNDTITDSGDLGAILCRPASGTSVMLRGGVRLPGDSAGVFHSYTVNPSTRQITIDIHQGEDI